MGWALLGKLPPFPHCLQGSPQKAPAATRPSTCPLPGFYYYLQSLAQFAFFSIGVCTQGSSHVRQVSTLPLSSISLLSFVCLFPFLFYFFFVLLLFLLRQGLTV